MTHKIVILLAGVLVAFVECGIPEETEMNRVSSIGQGVIASKHSGDTEKDSCTDWSEWARTGAARCDASKCRCPRCPITIDDGEFQEERLRFRWCWRADGTNYRLNQILWSGLGCGCTYGGLSRPTAPLRSE